MLGAPTQTATTVTQTSNQSRIAEINRLRLQLRAKDDELSATRRKLQECQAKVGRLSNTITRVRSESERFASDAEVIASIRKVVA